MISKFPVAWMSLVLTILTSADALAAYTQVFDEKQMAWVNLAVAVLTAVLGKLAHGAVTPMARPRDNDGTALVRESQ